MISTFENEYGVEILNIFGSNEGIAFIATPDKIPSPHDRAVLFPRTGVLETNSSGANMEFVQSKVIDAETGEELVEQGASGELCISGPTVFDGYIGTDNHQIYTPDGFFRTGDLVELCGPDADFYRITGRLKDIINRGGMKISPVEIETLLDGLRLIEEAAVCAYPDSVLGEKVCVCIVLAADKTVPSLKDICEFLSAKGLAKFKLPERLHVVAALPRNPLGKVLRHELSAALPPQ